MSLPRRSESLDSFSCFAAYGYCGEEVSACTSEGGWEIDRTSLSCQIGVGSGDYSSGASTDVPADFLFTIAQNLVEQTKVKYHHELERKLRYNRLRAVHTPKLVK